MRADPELIRQARALHEAPAVPARPPTVRLNEVDLHAVTESQCIRYVLSSLAAGRGGWVVTPNLDHMRRAAVDEAFRAMLAEADLVVADGMPLVWASRVQGTPLPERVAGSSLTLTLTEAAALRGHGVFLLGGAPGAAAAAATLLAARFPGLPVVGQYGAPYGFEREPAEMEALRRQLDETRPAIVFVALGSPKQEWLIRELRHDLPGTWWLGVGISFSFVCGQVKRAPRWMQKAGLEWAHRLAQEPRRLGRRYLVEGPPFAASLLWHAGVCRCRGRGVKVEAAGAGTPL